MKLYELTEKILELNDDIYLKDELSYDAIKILERYGAKERRAGKQ